MMDDGRQRQRHGVTKNIVEGIGGVIVGAGLVLFLVNRFKARSKPAVQPATAAETVQAPEADAPPKRTVRQNKSKAQADKEEK